MMRLSLVLLVLTLTACAGVRTFDSSMQGKYVGQPIALAFQDFGKPRGEYKGEAGPTFVWQKRDSESVFGPSVTVGSGYNIFGGLNWQGVTYNTCVIRARTDGRVVTGITFEGNPGGCETITGYRPRDIGRKQDGNSDL